MNVLNILNTIRDNNSQMYQDRIPEATQENLSDIGHSILTYENLQNEFVNALVNKIAFTIVSNRRYKNDLAVLKSGRKEFGNAIEEVYINPAKDKGQSTSETEVSDLLGVEYPDVSSIYHSLNRKGKYKASTKYEDLKRGFTSLNAMEAFITGVIDSMYSGDEIDERKLMIGVIADAISNEYIVNVPLDYTGDEASAKELVVLLKTLAHDFTEPSMAYNGFNVIKKSEIEAGTLTGRITWTPREHQVLLIRSDIDARTDVEVLAKAFNMEKAEFSKRKFVVSSFGDENVLAVICDDAFFKFYDDVYTTRKFSNGNNLVDTYFLHHHQTISVSLFANAVAITKATETTETTSVSEEPEEQTA